MGPTLPVVIIGVIAAAVLLATFVWQERRTSAPLIDLQLFRIPAFAGGVVAIVLSYAMLYGMFFLMSFALIRGYHDSPLAAGLRLAIIPVALGVVAPFSGALHERLGVRSVLLSGMVVCVAALILLSAVLTGTASSFVGVMIALAVYGAGLGIFIAPNNSATMQAAPDSLSGEAGGLLNLMRMFGTSIGVACPSAMLTRLGDSTLAVSEQSLLGGVTDALLLLMVFAIVAGVTSMLRGTPRTPAIEAA